MSSLEAKAKYGALGVDTDAAIEKLKSVPVALHCWQGDDVRGFDTDPTKPLTGGIQTTGNYPGQARTPEELMADLDLVLKLCPGTKKMNLHASYAIFEEGEWADRDKLEPKHFKKWVDFCKERGLGCDFNPTFFSHPKANGLTLSSPDPEIRKFWIDHGKACIRISNYLAEELGQPCIMNIWTGDGFKDIPADRMGPRIRYKEAIDEILSEPFDFEKVKPCVESKVFGIGVEAYTVGSAEFTLSYAAMNKDRCIPLMDNGHYHPTEVVSDKVPALLAFFPEVALHITRPIRWDSDHVVLLDDETKELCKEIVRCGGLEGRVKTALDYFDASINHLDPDAGRITDTRFHEKMDDFIPRVITSEEQAARRDMITLIRRSYKMDLFTATQGTYSVRLSDDSFLITPYGRDRAYLEEDDLVRVKADMKEQGKTPSRAVYLHQKIYKKHPEVRAILQAQPVHAMAFAVTDADLDARTIPESYILLRDVKNIPYQDVYLNSDKVAGYFVPASPAMIVENECVIVTGNSLLQAFDRLEVMETTAHSVINSADLGPIVHITGKEIDDLKVAFNLVD